MDRHVKTVAANFRHFGSIFKDWMSCFNEDLSEKEKRIFEKFHQMTQNKNKDELQDNSKTKITSGLFTVPNAGKIF